jgi:hypothetical protein
MNFIYMNLMNGQGKSKLGIRVPWYQSIRVDEFAKGDLTMNRLRRLPRKRDFRHDVPSIAVRAIEPFYIEQRPSLKQKNLHGREGLL